jgi:hypothetical protein
MNDSSSLEIVEWGEPRLVLFAKGQDPPSPSVAMELGGFERRQHPALQPTTTSEVLQDYEPGIIMQVRFREKNVFGAKMLEKRVFLIQDGRVVQSAESDMKLHLPGSTAVERVAGKLTKVIVRGSISHQGTPLKMTKSPDDEALDVSFIRERADWSGLQAITVPPRYEISGVPPGNYLVSVAWDENTLLGDKLGPYDLDILDEAYSPKKTPLSCVVTDDKEVQYLDIDLKGAIPTCFRLERVGDDPMTFRNSTWQLELSVTGKKDGRFSQLGHDILGRITNLTNRPKSVDKIFFVVRFSGGNFLGPIHSDTPSILLSVEGGQLPPGTTMPIKQPVRRFADPPVRILDVMEIDLSGRSIPDAIQSAINPQ